ncbi:putative F-box domain-containing protein [Tanacetum coccineum]
MKYRMILSTLWSIDSWKKLFLCGKKSLEKPTVELSCEIIESEVLPRLHGTVELPREIIKSDVLPRLHTTVELPRQIIESEVLPRHHATVELPRKIIESEVLPRLHAMVELSCEIIDWEILRLPAESLCRFMCVCKQWKSHISTCEFTRENLQHINKESLTHRKVL